MGTTSWMLVYAETNAREALRARPRLLPEATRALVSALFAGERLDPLADGDLSLTNPPVDELLIGCFRGVSIVAAREFALDYPSRLAPHFIAAAGHGTLTLHAMHSVVDWFALASWSRGRLVRALSVSSERGYIEDFGTPLPFETAYRDGADTVTTAVPFNPLDLAEAARASLFGYRLEGVADPSLLDPATIPLLRFRRVRKRWWAFWR